MMEGAAKRATEPVEEQGGRMKAELGGVWFWISAGNIRN